MESDELSSMVARVVQQRDEAVELCREMLATLTLLQNASVTIGDESTRDEIFLWRNRLDKFILA